MLLGVGSMLAVLSFIGFVYALWALQIRQSRENLLYSLFEDSLYHIQINGPDGEIYDPLSGRPIWYKYQGQGIPGYDQWIEDARIKYEGKSMSPKEAMEVASRRWIMNNLPTFPKAPVLDRLPLLSTN